MFSEKRSEHSDEVHRGDIRGAVRFITEREKGSMLMPDEIDEKTGDSVEDVLRSKHPESSDPKSNGSPLSYQFT